MKITIFLDTFEARPKFRRQFGIWRQSNDMHLILMSSSFHQI